MRRMQTTHRFRGYSRGPPNGPPLCGTTHQRRQAACPAGKITRGRSEAQPQPARARRPRTSTRSSSRRSSIGSQPGPAISRRGVSRSRPSARLAGVSHPAGAWNPYPTYIPLWGSGCPLCVYVRLDSGHSRGPCAHDRILQQQATSRAARIRDGCHPYAIRRGHRPQRRLRALHRHSLTPRTHRGHHAYHHARCNRQAHPRCRFRRRHFLSGHRPPGHRPCRNCLHCRAHPGSGAMRGVPTQRARMAGWWVSRRGPRTCKTGRAYSHSVQRSALSRWCSFALLCVTFASVPCIATMSSLAGVP